MRVVSLESPLKGHQPLYVFNFLFLILNIKNNFKVLSCSMQKGLQSSCLFGSRFACAQAAIFFAKSYSINAGATSIGLGLRLVSELHNSAIQTKKELDFGGFFHQVTVLQPIGRQDSMQTVNRTSKRLDSFLHEAP